MTAWASAYEPTLHIARHLPGSDELDLAFGGGGAISVGLNPPATSSDLLEMGYTRSDDSIVVVWLSTDWEYHSNDVLTFDRYEPATGLRKSRVTSPAPDNSWCDDVFEGDDDPGEWCADGSEDEDPRVSIVDTAAPAVAVETYAKYDYDSGSTGISFFNPATGGSRFRLSLADTDEPRALAGNIQSLHSVDGVMVATRFGVRRISGWSQVASMTVPSGCRVWGGPSSRYVRTCPENGGYRVSVHDSAADPTGQWVWEQIIAWTLLPVVVTELSDGKVGMVNMGCVTADPCSGRTVAVRATSNTVERSDLGSLATIEPPVSLGANLPVGVVGTSHTPTSATLHTQLAFRTPNPLADAGVDQRIASGATTTLDGSKSVDPGGQPITYYWEQVLGPLATITDPRTARPTIKAPSGPANLGFRLTVTDSDGLTGTDEVGIMVNGPAAK